MTDKISKLGEEKKRFANAVYEGLSRKRKYISSMYIYDKKGSQLFQEIMKLPEYYLTGCEYEILQTQSSDILDAIGSTGTQTLITEFGAGDGTKTKLLLKKLTERKDKFVYMPIDISRDAIQTLLDNLAVSLPNLHTRPVNMEYFQALDMIKDEGRKKLVLFLGSNIGNFLEEDSISFLSKINDRLNPGDYLLIGMDMKKNPHLIRAAYNDPQGVTARFNKNLLHRINKELGGDFDVQSFTHYESYDPVEGICRSYLISNKKQSVCINDIGLELDFEYAEPIHTEISRKYSMGDIERLASLSGFSIVENFQDCKGYFTDSLWIKV
jgi:dimethylhistidine N-methyltransferase